MYSDHDMHIDLLKKLVTTETVNYAGGLSKQTPLHLAVQRRRWNFVKYLVDQGADIAVKDGQDSYPLEYMFTVSEQTPLEMVQLLSTPAIVKEGSALAACLSTSASVNFDIVDCLLNQGACIEKRSDSDLDAPIVSYFDKISEAQYDNEDMDIPLALLERLIPSDPESVLTCILQVTLTQSLMNYEVRFHYYDILTCLLQHLPTTKHQLNITLHHGFRYNSYCPIFRFDINGTEPYDNLRCISSQYADMLYELFKNMCVAPVKVFESKQDRNSDRMIESEGDFVDAIEKLSELNSECMQISSLKDICIFNIRHSMSCKSTDSFKQLGLPVTLLDFVTQRHLAQRIIDLWKFNEDY